eukprot:3940362-Rhodomonas_salina.2
MGLLSFGSGDATLFAAFLRLWQVVYELSTSGKDGVSEALACLLLSFRFDTLYQSQMRVAQTSIQCKTLGQYRTSRSSIRYLRTPHRSAHAVT